MDTVHLITDTDTEMELELEMKADSSEGEMGGGSEEEMVAEGEMGVGSERGSIPLQEVASSSQEALAADDSSRKAKLLSSLRQKKSRLVSSLSKKKSQLVSLSRDLDWHNVTIISCLFLAHLLCNASYSIISPFFPKEARWLHGAGRESNRPSGVS